MAIQVWNGGFQATPAGTDPVSEGDDRIRELKETIRAELKVEHDAGDATIDPDYLDTARHKTGSARTFFNKGSVGAPTSLMKHSNAGSWPPTVGEVDKVPASGSLDNGRLWVDWEDGQPYFHEYEDDGAGNWTPINTNYGVPGARWISMYPRSWTVTDVATTSNEQVGVINAREDIDGLAGLAVTIPDDGKDYEIHVVANMKYGLKTGGQMGFWLMDTTGPGAPNDLDVALLSFRGQGGGGVTEATLQHTNDAPTNGSTYTYKVQFAANIAANDCQINPSVINAAWALNGAAAGVFVGVATYSRLSVCVRPRYLTGTYCF